MLQWLWVVCHRRDHRLRDPTRPGARPGGAGDRARLSRRAAARRLAVVSLFTAALHQTCLAHLLRRCRRPALGLSRASRLWARSKPFCRPPSRRGRRYRRGDVSPHGLAVARGHYTERLGAAAGTHAQSPGSRCAAFRQHLIVEFNAIFSFLLRPDPRRHQLARRTGDAARGRHPQNVRRRQSHRARRGHAASPAPVSCAPPISAASMPPISWSHCSLRPRPIVPPSLRTPPAIH